VSGFDEAQHPRDEKGRFAGSSLGMWARNQQKGYEHQKKLEGYSAGDKSDARAWVKGQLSSRGRDIEVPLIRKTESMFNLKDTGELSNNSADIERARDFCRRGFAQADKEKDQAIKEARKAQLSAQKYIDKVRDKTGANLYPGEKKPDVDPKEIAKLEKKRDAAIKARATAYANVSDKMARFRAAQEANFRIGDLHNQLELGWRHTDLSVEAAHRGEFVLSKKNGEIEHDNKSDYKFSVSHDLSDGSWEIHVHAPMRDPRYPGEKEMAIDIHPNEGPKIVSIDKRKQLYFDHSEKHKDTAIDITTQFPTNGKGKEHPLQALHEDSEWGKDPQYTGVIGPKHELARVHFENFFHEVDTSK
jgi:hypothetical protein